MSITTVIRRLFSRQTAEGPLELLAARTAGVSVGVLVLLALAGASVRVLPWLLDPRVPWRVAVPFGRAVASVAVEAAVLVGWPVGWALAAFVLIERGEARVLAMLGERPLRTTARLAPMAILFAAVLAGASLAGGRDASEPGRVLADLLGAGRVSCVSAKGPRAVDVPLLGAAWLCDGAGGGRLVGHPPFSHDATAVYTARAVDVSRDARRIALDDAHVAGLSGASLHVSHALFRLPPFVRASSLPGAWRAVFLGGAGVVSALFAVWLLLVLDERTLGFSALTRFHALLLGAAGPVSALALLHTLERAEAPMPLGLYATLPAAAAVATGSIAILLARLSGVGAPGR